MKNAYKNMSTLKRKAKSQFSSRTPIKRSVNRSISAVTPNQSISKQTKLVSRVVLKKKIKDLEFEKQLIFGELQLTRDYAS
jgi:hypothetical protein